jgi:hypothetical protein
MSNTRVDNEMTKSDLGHCKIVKVSDIKVSPFNVRDQEVEPITSEKFQELCDSIKTDGIIEPLVVRPSRDGGYETVAGTRRLRALQHLKFRDAPVIVREMGDNDVRIASLVENIHRDDLTENEKQRTLEDIYIAAWEEWKPENWRDIMPREKNKRSGKITTYDLSSRIGRLVLAKQFAAKVYQETTRTYLSRTQKSQGRTEIVKPTDSFRELRQRIGYTASTQSHILAGGGSGRRGIDPMREMPAISRRKFDEDERIKALDLARKKELAKKQRQALIKSQTAKKKSRKQIVDEVTDRFFKEEEKKAKATKQKQSEEDGPKPVVEVKPELEGNPVRARQEVIRSCLKLFRTLTGEDLTMESIHAGETQVKSKHANDTMKEIATFYIREGELANLQMAIIPMHQALGRFIDLVYDSIESEHKKDDMLRP